MKKFITLVLILSVAIVNLHAADIAPVNENIKKAFVREFTTVKDVAWSWIADGEVFKASFMFEGNELNAYFSKDGQFIGTSRYISKQQMPVIISQQLEKKYSNYVVRTIIENASKDQTSYYITVEGQKAAFMLKATPAGELTYFKKLKKPF